MTTETRTSPVTTAAPAGRNAETLKSFLLGAAICAPAVALTIYMMSARIAWPMPALVSMSLMLLAVANFALLAVVDAWRRELGVLTMPALLSYIGMSMLYVITQDINRFVDDTAGYAWLTPFAIVALAVIYGGALRERIMPVRLFLCLDALALTVMWCLGDVAKLSLPF